MIASRALLRRPMSLKPRVCPARSNGAPRQIVVLRTSSNRDSMPGCRCPKRLSRRRPKVWPADRERAGNRRASVGNRRPPFGRRGPRGMRFPRRPNKCRGSRAHGRPRPRAADNRGAGRRVELQSDPRRRIRRADHASARRRFGATAFPPAIRPDASPTELVRNDSVAAASGPTRDEPCTEHAG